MISQVVKRHRPTNLFSRCLSLTKSASFSTKGDGNNDPYSNIPQNILDLTERKLYSDPQHPLSILIDKTMTFFTDEAQGYTDVKVPGEKFQLFSGMSPFVSPEDCFDALFIPKDHVSRRPTDTYYQSKDVCLRTHTSVHQIPIIKDNNNAFLVMGDVYRKDTVDRTHYPAFHQMEGVRIFDIKETFGTTDPKEAKILIRRDL